MFWCTWVTCKNRVLVVWLIGLAGAGKTTIGKKVFRKMKTLRPNTVFLDGDSVRKILGTDLGHSVEDRRKNAWRICRLCQYLDNQNINVICSILSIFHDTQEWNRENYESYFEVFIDVPMEILIERDQKGLYSGSINKTVESVVGMDIPFSPPPNADLILQNYGENNTVEEMAELVFSKIH